MAVGQIRGQTFDPTLLDIGSVYLANRSIRGGAVMVGGSSLAEFNETTRCHSGRDRMFITSAEP